MEEDFRPIGEMFVGLFLLVCLPIWLPSLLALSLYRNMNKWLGL